MVVEEIERCAQGEGVEPQTDLGQLHRHRVDVDSVDAALENVPLQQIDIGQFDRIDGDSLFSQ